jgi:hypothetical protein
MLMRVQLPTSQAGYAMETVLVPLGDKLEQKTQILYTTTFASVSADYCGNYSKLLY